MANLIEVDEYKELEGVTSGKEDVKLEILVPSISQLVKTYCGNSIVDYYSTPKVETISVEWPTHLIQLTESPVVQITSVEERSSHSSAYATLDPSLYYLESNTDSLLRLQGSSGYTNWQKGPGSVRVTYTAGYSQTPGDLKLAVADLITYYLKDEHKQRQTLSGASVENQSSTSQRNNVAFPDHIKRVLDLYKNF
jgi:hypothetical protein